LFTTYCECGEAFHASEEHVGRSILCRKCGRQVALAPPSARVHNVKSSADVRPAAQAEIPTRGAWDGKGMRNYVPRSRRPWYYIGAAIVFAGVAIGAAYFVHRSRVAQSRPLEPASATDDPANRP
jgi:hypothetical protein